MRNYFALAPIPHLNPHLVTDARISLFFDVVPGTVNDEGMLTAAADGFQHRGAGLSSFANDGELLFAFLAGERN